jgi:putative chitinase
LLIVGVCTSKGKDMSKAMRTLQEKVGVGADGAFGPNTARAIAKHYELSPARAAHLLGQSAHESGYFKLTEENLNYSEGALNSVFGRYFGEGKENASDYARNPQKIANYVYMDKHRSKGGALGNTEDNDGWAFRGRGFLQCTGRANYRKFASEMRLPDVMKDPDLVATDYAFESAYWFFDRNGLFSIADKGVNDDVITQVTRRVNGGTHGLDDRLAKTHKIYSWLAGA